ncbi:hypothetical protein [Clostridium sp.]|uniref:hypothetical protein n=1 Tax=Clostridium sp. TaxID=1506 RepID=UPI0035A173FD
MMFEDDKPYIIEAKNKCKKYSISYPVTGLPNSNPDITLQFLDSDEEVFKKFHYVGKEAMQAEIFINNLKK